MEEPFKGFYMEHIGHILLGAPELLVQYTDSLEWRSQVMRKSVFLCFDIDIGWVSGNKLGCIPQYFTVSSFFPGIGI
jgi:hypothetical protein